MGYKRFEKIEFMLTWSSVHSEERFESWTWRCWCTGRMLSKFPAHRVTWLVFLLGPVPAFIRAA